MVDYDWEAQDAANLMKRYNNLMKDEDLVSRAKKILQDEKESLNNILKKDEKINLKNNPATIKKL